MLIALIQDLGISPTLRLIFLIAFFTGMALVIGSRFYVYFEQLYAEKHKRPFFLNFILFKKKLSSNQLRILEADFSFYKLLTLKEQDIFRHRVATFIKEKDFICREGLSLTDEIKILVSATAIMMTFGFRKYLNDIISTIVLYPEPFYSHANESLHRGEVNPRLGAIVFSWEDFKKGYDISNDNLNLGVHEFGHAIHINSFKSSDVSAMIFNDSFSELKAFLKDNEDVRQELIASKYFREYAYNNEFEFVAVLLENFIETPIEFKQRFPEIYRLVKQMLNFNFAGY